jgi:tetratricopeptide (TPR) repeat protein
MGRSTIETRQVGMKLQQREIRLRGLTFSLAFVLLAVFLPGSSLRAQLFNHSPGLDQGYFDMYNVNFAAAHAVFQSWLSQHPDDGLAAASDAAAYLFGEFDRLHIIDVQLFADQSRFDNRSRLIPDPAVRKAFDDRTAQAERLADAALQRNPKDARAFYTKTLVYGMRSDYALMIEKKDLAALSLTKQASAYSKQALALDPHMYDAYLASGVENYMLSLKPVAVRWILGITGASTDREQGIKLLTLTANQGHYLAPFARMMLAVAAIRDGNPQLARSILTALSRQYPDNSLYERQLARIH